MTRPHGEFLRSNKPLLPALTLVLVLWTPLGQAQDHRGIAVTGPETSAAQPVTLRSGYALVVGASQYESARWPDLTTIPQELQMVGDALRRQGFRVRTETDLPSSRLIEVVRDFIATHGSDRSNRLVFYFSGHGYSRDNGNRGYFVPVDSPFPQEDEIGFLKKALDMNQVVSWARQLEASQALFVFDSCFSGTLFMQRGSGESLVIQKLSAAPVREFITAGSAGETVPANSDFALAFAQALNDGLADTNRDGYTTGTELGMYLQGRIGALGRQTPWYGKIQDFALAQGEFVFRSGRLKHAESAPPKLATLSVMSTPPGASVYLDGRLEGITPVRLTKLESGRRRIELRADGYQAAQEFVDLQNGDERRLRAEMRPIERLGRLSVTTSVASARIVFPDTGQEYQQGMVLPAGDYRIRVSAAGFKTRTLDVRMNDSDVKLYVDLAEQPVQVVQRGVDASRAPQYPVSGPQYAPSLRSPTCYARNTFGYSFWWMAPDLMTAQAQVMRACQMSTPLGGFCQLTTCS